MELNEFRHYCNVLVLDISKITTPKFSRRISAKRSESKEVIVVTSLFNFIRRAYELRKRSAVIDVCVLNEVRWNSFIDLLCNLVIGVFLKRKCIAIMDLYNGGVPIHYPDAELINYNFVKCLKFRNRALFFAKKNLMPAKIVKKISYALFNILGRFALSTTTHRLIAGDDWLMLARQNRQANNQPKLVFGHSHDYSNNLLCSLKPSKFALPQKKIAVLLDSAGPMFESDSLYMKRKVYFTADIWYPKLTRFFEILESKTGVSIEIAGHYKSTHPEIAPYFGNRRVHYGKTRDLVLNSEFVITRASTAISYAIIFRKPIIFIYSNQLKEDYFAMKDIRGMAAMLGSKPVNIDDLSVDMESLLKIDEKLYRNYEKICLTSNNSQRPNAQIILEDIMNINTEAQFMKRSTT